MTDSHTLRQTEEERKHVDRTLLHIDEHVRILTLIYPSCETNAAIIASFLATAAILRAKHICTHEPPGAHPSSKTANDSLESMIDCLSCAYTKSIDLAVKTGPDKPLNTGEMLQRIFALLAAVAPKGKPK